MDLFRSIEQDHREIEDLLSRLADPPERARFDDQGRTYLRDRLLSVAARHEAAEELTVWPAVRRRLPSGPELADRALADERAARAILDLLRITDSEEDLVTEGRRAASLIGGHIAFEEQTVLPSLRRHSTRLWAAAAGTKFQAARRFGPTRPHPNGPDRPFGLLTTGAAAAAVDHLRDLRHRSRRHPVGFEESAQADAVAVLTEDHDRIRRRLDDAERPRADDAAEDRAVHEAIRALSVHDSIERQHLYPVVRVRLDDGPAIEADLLAEHGEVARLAAKLEAYRFHDQARSEWVREMATRARAHIEREETTVLAPLAARLTTEELVDLGARLATARPKAPTRPHPHVAGSGLWARLGRPTLRPLDRARDLLARRRSA